MAIRTTKSEHFYGKPAAMAECVKVCDGDGCTIGHVIALEHGGFDTVFIPVDTVSETVGQWCEFAAEAEDWIHAQVQSRRVQPH